MSSLIIEHYTRLFESGVARVVVANAAVSLDGIISKYNPTSLIIKYVLFVAKESLNRAIPLSLHTFLSSILPYREYSPFRMGEIP